MTTKAQDAWEILTEPFIAGSRVINCVSHSELNFDQRPDGCELCRVDVKNHLTLAIRINEFLNSQVSRAKDALFAHLHQWQPPSAIPDFMECPDQILVWNDCNGVSAISVEPEDIYRFREGRSGWWLWRPVPQPSEAEATRAASINSQPQT